MPEILSTGVPVYACGFSRRKRQVLQRFFGDRPVRFVRRLTQVPPGAELCVWGRTEVDPALPVERVWRVEDGFLRSVGLGAAFAPPASWVIDGLGLYYDPRSPSDLEQLLQTQPVGPELLARARSLRRQILRHRLSKYNLLESRWRRPNTSRKVCLAVGQVEGDASLCLGSPTVRSNLALVQAIRAEQPDVWLVYKPHPDVSRGLRDPGPAERQVSALCDAVVTDVDITDLIEQVDEVHVMTSLTGFEALLRHKPVVTHGQPFYAGWGLTHDRLPLPRRSQRRSLDELVACALLLYPRYLSKATGRLCSPEQVLQELVARRAAARTGMAQARRWLGEVAGRLRRVWGAAG